MSDVPREELRAWVGAQRRRALLTVAGCLAVAALAGWRGAGVLRAEHYRGGIYVRNGAARRITVRLCSGRPEDGTWDYGPYEGSGKSLGTYLTHKERKVLLSPGDRLAVSEWNTTALRAALDDGTLLRWDAPARCWTVDLDPALFGGVGGSVAPPDRATPVAAPQQRGEVFARNLSGRSAKIRFKRQGQTAAPGYWAFNAGHGRDKPNGIRLLDNGKPQIAATGDILLLEIAEAGTAVVRLGDPGVAAWRDGAWRLTIDDRVADGRAGVVRVRNRTDWSIQLVVRRPDGETYGSQWGFDPREGAGRAGGLTLQIDKQDVVFRGEDRIEVTATTPGTERSLIVGRTPEPAWRAHERCWLLDLKGDPRK